MINTTPERLQARNFFICRYFSFYEQMKFCAQLSWAWKKNYNLRARLPRCSVWAESSIGAYANLYLLQGTSSITVFKKWTQFLVCSWNRENFCLLQSKWSLLSKRPEVFMVPWIDQKWNLFLIFTFYIISQVSIFNFHLTWLLFQIFWIKSDITEGL